MEETRSDKSKILATLEVLISCFNYSTARTHRVDSVSEVMPESTIQTHHVDSTLKRRGNDRFHVVSTWNPRGVFVGYVR